MGSCRTIGTIAASGNARVHVGDEINNNYHTQEEKYPVKRLERLRNPCFTGRREQLDKIDALFWPKAKPLSGRKKMTLYGLAGAGKSAVALEYAHRRYAEYDAIFWIQASNAAELEMSASLAVADIISHYRSTWDSGSPGLCKRIASALHMFDELPRIENFEDLTREAADGRQNIERLKAWLPRNSPWLLVLDGYNDAKAHDIDRLLPSTGVGHVLVTTQDPAIGASDEKVAIEPSLGDIENMELLNRVARQSLYCCPEGSNCQHAKSIIEFVGGLPLAIGMIGADIHNEQVTFETYAQKLPSSSSSSSSGGDNAEPAVDPRLLGIFESTFEKLSQNARELMQLCSLLANTDVPIKLLQGGEGVYVFDWMKDSKAIEKAVIELHSYSLNSQSSGNRILSIHSLVHKHAGTTLKAQQRRQLSQRVVKMVTAAFDSGHGNDTKSWTYELSILPHARCCSDILRRELAPREGPLDVETRELAYRLARAYSRLGHVRGVAALYELGLRDVEPQSARDPAVVVDMMNSFGISLRLQAEYDKATQWHALAKEFIEKVPSPLDPLMALEAEQHMAAILMDQCRYDEAKEALERVLQQQQGRLGENDASILRTQAQHDLGMVLLHIGEPDGALERFEAVRQFREKRHGDNHPMTLEAAHSIAMALQEMGKQQESLNLHQEILEKRKERLGVEHYSTLDTMDSITLLYERQGKYDEALQMNQEVQRKLEGILLGAAADNHPWLLRVRSRTADIELRLGRYGAAREGYESVYRGFKARGMMLNDAWSARTNVARVLRDVGKYDEALADCEEALRGLQGAEKPGDPGFVTAVEFCKATILELQGRFGEALQLYDEVARKEEERFGPDNLDALQTKCFAGSAMAKLGWCKKALQLYEDIEEKLQRRTDGLGHSLIKLLANHNKADVLEQLGRCEEALAIYGEVCSTREQRPENQAEYHRAVHGKGRAYIRKGELEEGLKFFQDAINGWKSVFGGPDHPLIFAALEDMGNALLQQGGPQLSEARSRCGEALEGCRKMLRDGHPQTCRAKVSLSAVLSKQNRLEEASKECAAGLQGLRAELGNDHPWALRAARTLAGIKWRQRRYWEACRLYIAVARGLRKARTAPGRRGRGSLAP